jgi:hypothetical protein
MTKIQPLARTVKLSVPIPSLEVFRPRRGPTAVSKCPANCGGWKLAS